jgi:AcrR family transcriptional regulator
VATDVKGLTRKQRAAATRLAIVRAASELFRSAGYHSTTMAAIAERAGVAVQTVYYVFATKPQLLSATIDLAVLGEDDPAEPQAREWWLVATGASDPRTSVEAFVHGATEIQARVGELDLVLRAGAQSDPDLAKVWAGSERLRDDGFKAFAQSFADRNFLRPGLGVEEATDLLLTIVGPFTYLAFSRDRGWSDDRIAKVTIDMVCHLLLP